MLSVIRFKDLVEDKSAIDLPEKLVHAAFELLLIGYVTNDGCWAQGPYNWAYNKCDDIIRSCEVKKLNISEFLSALCAAAKVHGNLYITTKGANNKTIAFSSSTDASDKIMSLVTDDDLRFATNYISEICADSEGGIRDFYRFNFASLCAHILNTLYAFFIQYDVEKIFVNLKAYLGSINNPRALEMYHTALKQLTKKYKFK